MFAHKSLLQNFLSTPELIGVLMKTRMCGVTKNWGHVWNPWSRCFTNTSRHHCGTCLRHALTSIYLTVRSIWVGCDVRAPANAANKLIYSSTRKSLILLISAGGSCGLRPVPRVEEC